MPQRATKDTYGTEMVGEVAIRRQIIAGQEFPEHYVLEDPSAAGDPADETAKALGYSEGLVAAEGETYEDTVVPATSVTPEQTVRRRGRPPKSPSSGTQAAEPAPEPSPASRPASVPDPTPTPSPASRQA